LTGPLLPDYTHYIEKPTEERKPFTSSAPNGLFVKGFSFRHETTTGEDMYPLQISMAVNELNFEHLAVIPAFPDFTFITGFIFYNGITFRPGDRSVDTGGLKKPS
jgi:hypothetical protein